MSQSLFNLRIDRRPIRWSIGLLAGLILGPLIACLLVRLPSNEWLGPYPPYVDDVSFMAAIIGLCCGLLVGLAVTLIAKLIQRWKWARSGRLVLGLESPPVAGPLEADLHIYRQADVARPSDEGIMPAPQ